MSREVSLIDLVAHELRTPLNVAMASLRQVEAAGPDAAALARARRACERLDQVATEMRDWARLSAAQPSIESVDLRAAVSEAVARAVATREPAIAARVGEVPAVAVTGVAGRLPEALSSLLAALVRAADLSDTIHVAARRDGPDVILTASRGDVAAPLAGAGFAVEWTGGLGFSLPLARIVIERAGGRLDSSQTPDGRPAAISVALSTAPGAPPG